MFALCAASDALLFVKPHVVYRYITAITARGISIGIGQTIFYLALSS